MRGSLIILSLLLAATPASAEIVKTSDSAFIVKHELDVAASPTAVWAILLQPGRWWGDDHTYSGDSANMTIDAQPGGCWCEKVQDGGVEHMRVVLVRRESHLRMVGGLGPLQIMPVNAVLDIELSKSDHGTHIAAAYVVGGPPIPDLKAAAPAVDQVMGVQWARLKAAAEKP